MLYILVPGLEQVQYRVLRESRGGEPLRSRGVAELPDGQGGHAQVCGQVTAIVQLWLQQLPAPGTTSLTATCFYTSMPLCNRPVTTTGNAFLARKAFVSVKLFEFGHFPKFPISCE